MHSLPPDLVDEEDSQIQSNHRNHRPSSSKPPFSSSIDAGLPGPGSNYPHYAWSPWSPFGPSTIHVRRVLLWHRLEVFRHPNLNLVLLTHLITDRLPRNAPVSRTLLSRFPFLSLQVTTASVHLTPIGPKRRQEASLPPVSSSIILPALSRVHPSPYSSRPHLLFNHRQGSWSILGARWSHRRFSACPRLEMSGSPMRGIGVRPTHIPSRYRL